MGRSRWIVMAATALMVGGVLCSSGDAQAAGKPALKNTSVSLMVTVNNGENLYGKTKLNLKKAKKLRIKKITYKSADESVASVSEKGVVQAKKPGETTITAKVKYSKKKAKAKTEKLRCKVSIKADFKADIPQTGMTFDESGKAKSIYPFTPLENGEATYSNEASYIQRFQVYVETEYDTDQDGKRDLIPAVVQVPASAVKGYYKAPVLMVPDVYMVYGHQGMNDPNHKCTDHAFDYQLLTASPEKRVPKSTVTTAEVVSGSSSWIEEDAYRTDNMSSYDYYLTRGYAVVMSPGLGGCKSAEGLYLAGEKVEAEAYAAIIEWMHGDRQAFADKKGTKAITADWCNGHAAMTGLSYVGTLAYEVATTGVKGLDTVIPMGAIASWYDATYSQGAMIESTSNSYPSYLDQVCGSRFFEGNIDEKDPVRKRYNDYLSQLNYDGGLAAGRFGEFWSRFDFRDGGKISVPGLLIEGLNDFNVTNKQTYLMRKAFRDHGQTVNVVLHQGGHEDLTEEGIIKLRGEYSDDLINRWMSHYLMGVENSVEQLPEFLVQSNIDGTWSELGEKTPVSAHKLTPSTGEAETTVSYHGENMVNSALMDENLRNKEGLSAVWEQDITQDMTLWGRGQVHLRAKMPDAKKNGPIMSVLLVDESDTEFDAYQYNTDFQQPVTKKRTVAKNVKVGEGLPAQNEVEFKPTKTKAKLITQGWINLLMPGAGWEAESCVSPAEPVKDDTYYDYVIHLLPEHYTVKKGHKLKLYVTGPSGLFFDPGSVKYTKEYTDKVSYLYMLSKEYQFTLDNTSCYAELPMVTT